MSDFAIPKGDNPSLTATVTGYTTITGFTITMAAKKNVSDTSAIFTVTATIVDPTAGTISFPLTTTDTSQPAGTYNYDVKIVDASGGIMHTKRSTFEITEPIT